MIQKYTFGAPFETDAVVALIPAASGTPAFGNFSADHGFSFAYDLSPDHKVYGLGEANRGIDKRGYVYVSCCSDDPIRRTSTLYMVPTTSSLYPADPTRRVGHLPIVLGFFSIILEP